MTLARLHEHARDILDARADPGNAAVAPTPGLLLLRSTTTTPLEGTIYDPVLCLILHGAKRVTAGDETVSIEAGDALIVSHGLPVMSTITAASVDAPYVACVLGLDMAQMRDLRLQVDDALGERPSTPATHALAAGTASDALIDALDRYVTLDHDGDEGRVLGQTIRREIYLRLLLAPQGANLRLLLDQDSNAALVARAIARIRSDYAAPISVAELARDVGMSTSSLHDHFRRVTSTTPLRYQKELRLQEARRLLAGAAPGSVTSVAAAVGYASPSQFSREYSRRFGASPSQHVTV